MKNNYTVTLHCRICDNRLEKMFYIAPQYIASTFVKSNKNNSKAKIKIPMTVMLCPKCGLVQLKETVNPDLLYREYFYRSNVSDTMRRDLQDVVDSVCELVPRRTCSSLDIGCNDGLMMSMFPKHIVPWGIDPAQNIVPVSDIMIIKDYFPSEMFSEVKKQFTIITSTACFYDFTDPNKSVQEMKRLLTNNGVICIQVSYLYDTIKDMNFYDFVHEHLLYYSLETIKYLFEKNDMKIFDATTNGVNGGSLRIYATHKNNKRKVNKNVEYLLAREKALRLRSKKTYTIFRKLIDLSAQKVRNYIKTQKGLFIGLGASTKGNVLLQLCKIDKKMMPYISERAPHKIGLRNLGLDMKLISEEEARKKNPVCMFVIPWNFKAEIVEREKEYIAKGGTLLFIMPYPYILDKNGEHRI